MCSLRNLPKKSGEHMDDLSFCQLPQGHENPGRRIRVEDRAQNQISRGRIDVRQRPPRWLFCAVRRWPVMLELFGAGQGMQPGLASEVHNSYSGTRSVGATSRLPIITSASLSSTQATRPPQVLPEAARCHRS